jgi:hypothetical protein
MLTSQTSTNTSQAITTGTPKKPVLMSLFDSRSTSTLNQDQEHLPNSLLPMFTDRQQQMFESLKFGCINDLAEVIYSFAQEDYEASRSGTSMKLWEGDGDLLQK